MTIKRNEKILKKEKTALLIIDIQKRILGVMTNGDRLIENTKKLIRGFKEMNLPIFFTEQYPKGLGETATELKAELESKAVQKLSFSCSGAEGLFKEFISRDITQIVVCGIETHLCV